MAKKSTFDFNDFNFQKAPAQLDFLRFNQNGPALTFIILLFIGTIWYVYRNEKKVNRKEKRPSIAKISEIVDLRIYPIKSCRGIRLQANQLLKTGLALDRNWMWVDAKNNEFLTIRQLSQMTLINTHIDDVEKQGAQLTISVHNAGISLVVPARPSSEWLSKNASLREDADIWEEKTDGYFLNEELTKPFDSFFERKVRLVYKGPKPRANAWAPELLGREQKHYFADMMSVLIGNEASLADLNVKLGEKGADTITIERFRPNIIIRGHSPWDEDGWKRVRILPKDPTATKASRRSGLILDCLARCGRCQVPNVNPDTAVKNKKEPWDTLMSFRRIDPGLKYKPIFGSLCVPQEEGKIEIGMRLEVLETTNNHVFGKTKFSDL